MGTKYFLTILLSSLIIINLTAGEQIDRKTISKFDFKITPGTNSILSINRQKLDVNHISAWFRNDGEFYSDHSTTGPGFEWPIGSGIYAVFSTGFWIGAKVQTDTGKEIRVATVGHFGSEFRPGRILPNGEPEDYTLPHLRLYKVRPLKDSPVSNIDYLEWPIDQGAPWIDVDSDGLWNPYVDKIGIRFPGRIEYPDMVTFCIFNDADSNYHTWFGRTKPLGVEVRQTAWAYENKFQDAHFIRFQIYNKGIKNLDSTYFALWSDPDLGDAFDDYVGSDTTKDINGIPNNLGYCYNGDNDDGPPGYGFAPPALGYKLLQGPLVIGNATDTGISFGNKFLGLKNQDISAFNYICKSNYPNCSDPQNYRDVYNVMCGLNNYGTPWIDNNGDTTKFMFAGDPVTGTGWLNSHFTNPHDERFVLSVGPVSLAVCDSQEVIYSVFMARGTDYLNSITELRNTSRFLNFYYKNDNAKYFPSAKLAPPNLYTPPFDINVEVQGALTVDAILENSNGVILDTTELYDDGIHNDGNPNDGIWGNTLNTPPDSLSLNIHLNIHYGFGDSIFWKNEIQNIPTSGRIKIENMKIISDNINGDSIPNVGENIKFIFDLRNNTHFPKNTLYVKDPEIVSLNTSNLFGSGIAENVPPDSSTTITSQYYTDGFFSCSISPSALVGDTIKIELKILGDYGNIWYDTLSFVVQNFTYTPIDTIPSRLSGICEGSFGVRLVDYTQLKNNNYLLAPNKVTTYPYLKMTLVNTTLNDTLFNLHDLPDTYGHNIPVTDGFKITGENFTVNKGAKSWTYSPSPLWFNGVKGFYGDIYLNGYGFIAYPTAYNFVNIPSGLRADSLRRVEIRFSKTQTQKAYRYIDGFSTFPPYLRLVKHPEFRPFVIDSNGTGFLYQDFEKYRLGIPDSGYVVPFTVWEVDQRAGTNKQLDVGIVERNDSLYRWIKTSPTDSFKQYIYYGNIDGKWNPSPVYKTSFSSYVVDGKRGDEVILIFDSEYSDSAKSIYTGGTTLDSVLHFDLLSKFPQTPIMYAVLIRRLNADTSFQDGDVLTITPYYPLTEADVFTFNPLKLLSVENQNQIPDSYKLYNNYPNPFNPQTTIKYDLQKPGKVVIEIFNLLGQKIRTLVNEEKVAGSYTTTWNGTTDKGLNAASGIYFYRIKTENFSNTKKMILMR
jgi:hypothetical protein